MNLILFILLDEDGGLGITQASMVSAVTDDTGDDGEDAVIKIKRLVNKCGRDFCMITNWPFLRNDISFPIDGTASKYSGAAYLPATFRKIMGAQIIDQNEWYPLTEISIAERYKKWVNPANNSGRPDEYVVTRPESGFWEIEFSRLPGQSYTFAADIEKQWVDLAATTDETVITNEFFTAFTHYVDMARFLQQGDSDNYVLYKNEWWDPRFPINSILGRILNSLKGPMKSKRVVMRQQYIMPGIRKFNDYNSGDYNTGKVRDYR